MTIPYADEIERMWARGKAVRRAYVEHMAAQETPDGKPCDRRTGCTCWPCVNRRYRLKRKERDGG